MCLFSIRQVSRVFTMGEVQVHALRNINLDIQSGEFLIIIGPSGSGKSTLLNLIGGMDRPSRGEIYFQQDKISHANDQQLTQFRRQNVGFIFQLYNLIPMLTALENVQVATEISDNPMDPLAALQLVKLADRAQHFPSQLSGGQQQRIAIARALATNPQLLLCDEPTGALDSNTSQQILQLLVQLNQEHHKTIVLITHNPDLTHLGHRVAHIVDGQIAELSTNE